MGRGLGGGGMSFNMSVYVRTNFSKFISRFLGPQTALKRLLRTPITPFDEAPC